jgi:hypothetical protein
MTIEQVTISQVNIVFIGFLEEHHSHSNHSTLLFTEAEVALPKEVRLLARHLGTS